MRGRRHIIGQAAVVAAVLTCSLSAPATASAGGIDAAKDCIERAYAGWKPASAPSSSKFAQALRLCNSAVLAHFMDTRKREAWQSCVLYGISRSVPPLGWEPAIYGLVSCSQTWLDFHPEIEP